MRYHLDSRAGFSLAEVLMALALLGTIGVSAVSLFGVLVSSATDDRSELVAHMLATDRMEACLDLGFAGGLTAGTVVEAPISGHSPFRRTTVITEESPGLLRIKVVVSAYDSADSLETLLANR